jgi:hypothetical protein
LFEWNVAGEEQDVLHSKIKAASSTHTAAAGEPAAACSGVMIVSD